MNSKKILFSKDQAFFWGVPALLWQVLFFYIPLVFLLSTSLVRYVPSLNTTIFSLEHFNIIFQSFYWFVLFKSMLVALITVFVCLLIAYPVAYYLAVTMRRWSDIFFALLVLPFWTNFLLLVYSWYFLLENDGIINSFLLFFGIIHEPLHLMHTNYAIFLGMFYCYLPFMILPLYSNLERLDVRLLEASYDLGAGYWTTFRKIVIPLTMPGIQNGSLLVFVPAFGEFVIPELLGGDKSMFVGSVITHYFLTMRNNATGSAFTVMISIILILFFLILMYCSSISRSRKNM